MNKHFSASTTMMIFNHVTGYFRLIYWQIYILRSNGRELVIKYVMGEKGGSSHYEFYLKLDINFVSISMKHEGPMNVI